MTRSLCHNLKFFCDSPIASLHVSSSYTMKTMDSYLVHAAQAPFLAQQIVSYVVAFSALSTNNVLYVTKYQPIVLEMWDVKSNCKFAYICQIVSSKTSYSPTAKVFLLYSVYGIGG